MQALQFNVFVIAFLAAFAAAWLWWALTALGKRIEVHVSIHVQVAAGITLLGFAVVRNLPGLAGLRG